VLTTGPTTGVLPLSGSQEGQWEFMSALSPDDPGRSRIVVVDNVYLHGDLDRVALRGAFGDVVARHEALRLTLESLDADPLVRVADRQEPPVEFLDLAALPAPRRRDRLDTIVFDEHRRCFDLLRGPLWHAWVIRLEVTTHLLTVSLSHLVSDGYAPKVLVRDLLSAYGRRTGMLPPPAGDPPSFAEVHEMQSRRLAVTSERLCYWRERLLPLVAGGHEVREVRPGANLLTRSRLSIDLPAGVFEQLRGLAWRARVSPYIVWMAAYHLLLSGTTGRDRTVISTATLGRTNARARRAVAQFATDPYVSTELPAELTLREAVRRTGASMTEATDNLMSYTAIARAVNPDFDAQRPWPDYELCDGNLYSAAYDTLELRIAGLRAEQVFLPGRHHSPEVLAPEQVSRAWLARCGPSVEIGASRDTATLYYNEDVYPAEEMRRLVDEYVRVVTVIAMNPEWTVARLREV
jgi:hypothetical protein